MPLLLPFLSCQQQRDGRENGGEKNQSKYIFEIPIHAARRKKAFKKGRRRDKNDDRQHPFSYRFYQPFTPPLRLRPFLSFSADIRFSSRRLSE